MAEAALTLGDVLIAFRLFIARKLTQRSLKHLADTAAMGTGNRQGLTQAHGAELSPRKVRVNIVDLVDYQKAALVALAQMLANHLIASGHPGTGIDQEQHHIGFFNGQQGLLGHLFIDAFLVAGDTTGIHQNVAAPFPLGLAILTVTGQPRQIANDRIAAASQTVEQGRLANVGAADQGDGGEHRFTAAADGGRGAGPGGSARGQCVHRP